MIIRHEEIQGKDLRKQLERTYRSPPLALKLRDTRRFSFRRYRFCELNQPVLFACIPEQPGRPDNLALPASSVQRSHDITRHAELWPLKSCIQRPLPNRSAQNLRIVYRLDNTLERMTLTSLENTAAGPNPSFEPLADKSPGLKSGRKALKLVFVILFLFKWADSVV